MKLFEWSPVPITEVCNIVQPSRYSIRLIIFSLLVFIPLACLGLLSENWPIYLQLLPLFISLFVFGMPHGGADHLLIWGMLQNNSYPIRTLSITLYAVIGIIYVFFWNFQPLAAAVFFLGLTIFHWGQGDRYISVRLHNATYLFRSRVLTIMHILSRGSIPILVPGFLSNETYRDVIEALVNGGSQASYQAQWVSIYSQLFLFVPLGLTLLYTFMTYIYIKGENKRTFLIDCMESIFLFGWFLFIPALWAIGCYFLLWHSLRHSLRILLIDSKGNHLLTSKQYFKLNSRWLQLTSLMTVIALFGMCIFYSISLSLKDIQLEWLTKALIGISVLTLPHTVVVCWMDHKQQL